MSVRYHVQSRPDGAILLTQGTEGIMVTPQAGGGAILLTGQTTDHPFDACPALLDRFAIRELIDILERVSGRATTLGPAGPSA